MKNREELLAAAKGLLNRDEPALHVVPAPPEGDGEPTEPMAVVPAAPAPLAGHRAGFLGQMRLQAAFTRQQARELHHREGSLPHRMWHAQPRSPAQHAEYVRDRRWVKPGTQGGVADKGGAAYQSVIGMPAVVIGGWISMTGESPLKAAVAYYAGLLPLTCLALWGLGDTALAVWIAVINIAIVAAVVLVLSALTGRRDEPPIAEVVTEDERPTS